MRKRIRRLTHAAIIAALYAVLTHLQNLILPGSASWGIQCRISEALCVLAFFTPAAIPGLTIGCLLANLLCGNIIWDVVFGTLATLLGAIGTRLLRKRPLLVLLPPILSNTIIVPFVLAYAYCLPGSVPFFMLTVGIGEVLSCGLLGSLLYNTLDKHKNQLF
mgnify:CR=1 FL=1